MTTLPKICLRFALEAVRLQQLPSRDRFLTFCTTRSGSSSLGWSDNEWNHSIERPLWSNKTSRVFTARFYHGSIYKVFVGTQKWSLQVYLCKIQTILQIEVYWVSKRHRFEVIGTYLVTWFYYDKCKPLRCPLNRPIY